MGALDERVTVITGAARGIGREHALLFAREGARVVVNDLGGDPDGSGEDASPAQAVVDEIAAAGGTAVASHHDVASFDGARELVEQAVETYGRLDVLVNNAGILRDRFLASMTEEEFDSVVKVHLNGHFCTLRHAAAHWKARTKRGEQVRASVINTASASGTLLPNPGQVNYGVAKAGIAALSLVAARELDRYGVRVNAIAPTARTRLTEDVPGIGAMMSPPEDGGFDVFHPSHVSPLVAWLATESCSVTARLFMVQGGLIAPCRGWEVEDGISADGPWTIDAVASGLGDLLD